MTDTNGITDARLAFIALCRATAADTLDMEAIRAVLGGVDKDLVLIAGARLMRAVCVSLARFMDCTVDDVLDETTRIVLLSNQ